ncbi:hypothetical protein ACQR18_27270, partial [Bradyrhizobium oligotrophicum]
DGGQQARRTRETAYKREDRRAGNAGVFGFACGTCRLHFFRRRAMGEAFTRHSLRPLHDLRGTCSMHHSGEARREITSSCLQLDRCLNRKSAKPTAVVPDKP